MNKDKILKILKLKKVQAAIFAALAALGLALAPETREQIVDTISEVVSVVQEEPSNE